MRIEARIRPYIPGCNGNTSWAQAWELIADHYILQGELNDIIIRENRDSWRKLTFTILQGDSYLEDNKLLNERTVCDVVIEKDEYTKLGLIPGQWNMEVLCRAVVNKLIEIKFLKKPRKTTKATKVVKTTQSSDLTDKTALKKKRDRITMKIWAWKKTGKDTTELEAQKNELTKQIKNL